MSKVGETLSSPIIRGGLAHGRRPDIDAIKAVLRQPFRCRIAFQA
jgi:hypothetical protein